jgi:hypothetical protein
MRHFLRDDDLSSAEHLALLTWLLATAQGEG